VAKDNAGATWLCCQLGAREHYAVPRALQLHGKLLRLVADAWVGPRSIFRSLAGARGRRLRERYHADLANAAVTHFTSSLVAHEFLWSAQGRKGWQLFAARNQWFQRQAAAAVATAPRGSMVFAHSYAALDIFRAAKRRGLRCVLAQIDPGERHFSVVAESAAAAPEYGPPPPAPPREYFEHWREECVLADRIVVNSEWSRRCLAQVGVPNEKMAVVPLAYDGDEACKHARSYPDHFTALRPLRLLYVGQISVSKGVKALLDSLTLLDHAPFELTMVGERTAQVPQRHLDDQRVKWIGPVTRSEVMGHYRDADVLIFPSLSDGFGMAQIEAHAWQLPIVASRSCGAVVTDGITGLLLTEVTAEAIAAAIRRLIADPSLLVAFSRNSATPRSGGLASLGNALVSLEMPQ
jgi:glycosyltransferase involved in cell wall biosynthesis